MENTGILKKALKANGFFSLFIAILTLIFGNSIVAFSEMARGLPINFAVQMVIFGSIVLLAAYRKKVPVPLVWIIIVLDFLYVIIEIINLSFPNSLSLGGFILIATTNLFVLIFAVFQTKGILSYSKFRRKSKT